MPRRNQRRRFKRPLDLPLEQSPKELTFEELARRLVRRGVCTPAILTHSRHGTTPDASPQPQEM